eukprot:s44_g26.t1
MDDTSLFSENEAMTVDSSEAVTDDEGHEFPTNRPMVWPMPRHGHPWNGGKEDPTMAPYLEAELREALSSPYPIPITMGMDHRLPEAVYDDVTCHGTRQVHSYKHDREPQEACLSLVATALKAHAAIFTKVQTVYLIVDSRPPKKVKHWEAFAPWWQSRRNLIGPEVQKRKRQM